MHNIVCIIICRVQVRVHCCLSHIHMHIHIQCIIVHYNIYYINTLYLIFIIDRMDAFLMVVNMKKNNLVAFIEAVETIDCLKSVKSCNN
jgi:hypothetical protein